MNTPRTRSFLAATIAGLAAALPAHAGGGCGNFGIAVSFGSGGYCGPSWSVGFSSGGYGYGGGYGGYGCAPVYRSCGYGGYGYGGGYGYPGYAYAYPRPVRYAPGCAPPPPCIRTYPSWSTGIIVTADAADRSSPQTYDSPIRTAQAAPLVRPAVTLAKGPAPKPSPDLDNAWKLLEAGDPGAMAQFSSLVAAEHEGGSPELGYAICAAAAGQVERAEWAARWALKQDPQAMDKLSKSDSLRNVAAAALAKYEDKTAKGAPRASREFALAVLSELAGDRSAAQSSAVLAGLGGDPDGSVTSLHRALGVSDGKRVQAEPAAPALASATSASR